MDVAAFGRIYREQVEPGGGGEIEYRLDVPRWRFLCWQAETKGHRAAWVAQPQDALDNGAWHVGSVYVLPPRGFVRQTDDDSQGVQIKVNQWGSPVSVRPLARLEVSPADFPVLDKVNGHDQPTVAARRRRPQRLSRGESRTAGATHPKRSPAMAGASRLHS